MDLHVVSVSGGKDSTALYLWAIEQFGRTGFRAVFADTGSEHPATVNYVRNLSELASGPEVEMVKADFSKQLAAKEKTPSGVPFLDMLMVKGPPSPKHQFCTEKLKLAPIRDWLESVRGDADVFMYVGIRAAESERRAAMPQVQFSEFFDCEVRRPLLYWSETQVFGQLNKFGVEPNPLYEAGYTRVGCFPCIYSCKQDLARMPDWAWQRLFDWETRSGHRFFPPGKGHQMFNDLKTVREWATSPTRFDKEPAEQTDVGSCLVHWSVCGT